MVLFIQLSTILLLWSFTFAQESYSSQSTESRITQREIDRRGLFVKRIKNCGFWSINCYTVWAVFIYSTDQT